MGGPFSRFPLKTFAIFLSCFHLARSVQLNCRFCGLPDVWAELKHGGRLVKPNYPSADSGFSHHLAGSKNKRRVSPVDCRLVATTAYYIGRMFSRPARLSHSQHALNFMDRLGWRPEEDSGLGGSTSEPPSNIKRVKQLESSAECMKCVACPAQDAIQHATTFAAKANQKEIMGHWHGKHWRGVEGREQCTWKKKFNAGLTDCLKSWQSEAWDSSYYVLF